MKFNTFIPFLFTIALAGADATQQIIGPPSDAQPYTTKAVVPFVLLVPGILIPLHGNVSVSTDNSGAFEASLFLERKPKPLTFSRTINFTAKNQAGPALTDTPCNTHTVQLSPLVAGTPITVPISFPVPGTNDTATGKTTVTLNTNSKLGLGTTIIAGNRNVSFSDTIDVGFPVLKTKSLAAPRCPYTILQDDCWDGSCNGSCCLSPVHECQTDLNCNKQEQHAQCQCVYGLSVGKICRCLTISTETSVNVVPILGIGGQEEADVDIFF